MTDPGPCIELPSPADDLVELRERAEAVYVDLQDDKEAWDGLHKVYADTITTLRAQLAAAEDRKGHLEYVGREAVEAQKAAETKLASARKALEEIRIKVVDGWHVTTNIAEESIRRVQKDKRDAILWRLDETIRPLSETTGGE